MGCQKAQPLCAALLSFPKLERFKDEGSFLVCSNACLMDSVMSLAAASYSHLIGAHLTGAEARPADACDSLLTERIAEQASDVGLQRHSEGDEPALPCPCQSSFQLSRDGTRGLEQTLWHGCGHLWDGVPCCLQRHEIRCMSLVLTEAGPGRTWASSNASLERSKQYDVHVGACLLVRLLTFGLLTGRSLEC